MIDQDRRVRRTHKLLGQALIKVALEKGYSHTTIQDVTERADIGYRTYFRHFSGLDELLVSVAQSTLNDLDALFDFPKQIDLVAATRLPEENGRMLFDYIQEHENIFRVLLLERGVRFCLQPVVESARQKVEQVLSNVSDGEIPLPIVANHVVDATFSLMCWWLENDLPYPPARMGELFARLILRPTWRAVIDHNGSSQHE